MEWRSVGVGGLVVVAGCGLLAGCGAPGDAADGLDGDDARQEEACVDGCAATAAGRIADAR
jgi:hypothetical protein